MNKLILLLSLLLLTPLITFAQTQTIYSQVHLTLTEEWNIQRLADAGIGIDHVHKHGSHGLELILNESELALLKNTNLFFEILIPDMTADYQRQLKLPENNLAMMNCGLEHFDEGEMGSYHTYDQIVSHINLMQAEFPALVNVTEIGKSLEGRSVFSVKISDNVATDESAQEGVVYYDALTHAREPISMESNLYYMWWLLENYGTDAEASYLIDHREMYFVPIVNPDGYVYNQTTNPDGGGYWRKNRRDNGDGSFGVDLNRNYSFDWGEPWGSSANPGSEIYHGESPFSEPEAQNVRDLVAQIRPAIAFSCHTYGDVFITPQHYEPGLPEMSTYYDFASEFMPERYRAYGTGQDLINYSSAGTTRSYLHTEGIYTYTPEFGHQFWEPPSEICNRIQEAFVALKYLSWVSGDYTTLNDFELLNEEQLWRGDVLELMVHVQNKGLRTKVNEVVVKASSPSTKLTVMIDQVMINDLEPRMIKSMGSALQFKLTGDFIPGEEIPIDISITQDGMISTQKRLLFYAGVQEELFVEDGEGGLEQWNASDDSWGVTSMDAYGGTQSIADSPFGNYEYTISDEWLALKEPIDLSLAENPFLEYRTKWSIEGVLDHIRLQVSTDNGSNWADMEGQYTDDIFGGFIGYTYKKHWVVERIDLKDYIGEANVLLRFIQFANTDVQGDGFYFDNFRVMNYTMGTSVGTSNPIFENEILLFPNPNTGKATLKWKQTEAAEATLVISDLMGRPLESRTLSMQQGMNTEVLEFTNNGFYLVEIKTERGTTLFRVLTLDK